MNTSAISSPNVGFQLEVSDSPVAATKLLDLPVELLLQILKLAEFFVEGKLNSSPSLDVPQRKLSVVSLHINRGHVVSSKRMYR